jgi:glycosyltransferase involved in cell wall biosynthesis
VLKGVPALRGAVRAFKRAWHGTPGAPDKPGGGVRAVDHPTWVPLTNSVVPEPPSARQPNSYGRRRAAMIDALNACDAVLAVSEFVRRKYESLGVSPRVISTMHIGSRMNRLSAAHRRVEPPPMIAPGGMRRPIRLVFLGFNNYFKGLPMLVDALALLTPEVLARFRLAIHAHSAERIEPRFRPIGRGLAGLTIRYGYEFEQIPSILAGADLGLVTSVWWDNAPQTVFEMLACGVPVLGADIGGIPDFIRDGHNGLLFRANDRYDLARRLAEVARDPAIVAGLRANARPTKGIDEHAREIIDLYTRLASMRRFDRTPAAARLAAGAAAGAAASRT